MTEMELTADRTQKARIFEMVFSDKNELLSLYNAVNGTDYADPDQLTVNTLNNAIYMSMHNDVSFLIDSRLSLYEHQSTYNPNLPLRCLFYIADLYSFITKDANLYGTKLVCIPTPRFIIFYNGKEQCPERQELRLYAETMKLEDAVERAINECIKEGILADFLSRNRAEAMKMSIYEYDEERHMRQTREEGFEDGFENGFDEGEISGSIKTYRSLSIPRETVIEKITQLFSLSPEQAQSMMQKYWAG